MPCNFGFYQIYKKVDQSIHRCTYSDRLELYIYMYISISNDYIKYKLLATPLNNNY